MLDTFNGLPVHILVVHAVVVLVPLMSLVTIAFVIRPKWRPGLKWAALGNLVALGSALLARASGQQLEHRLKLGGSALIGSHVYHGNRLWIFVLGLLIASLLAWFLVGRGGVLMVALALVLVLGAGGLATAYTVKTGESGSKAVWGGIVQSTNANVK